MRIFRSIDPRPPTQYTLKGSQRTYLFATQQRHHPCIAPSFNGRTSDSDSLNRGSNPWGATTTFKTAVYSRISGPRSCGLHFSAPLPPVLLKIFNLNRLALDLDRKILIIKAFTCKGIAYAWLSCDTAQVNTRPTNDQHTIST